MDRNNIAGTISGKQESGQALVEFALVMPVLALILFSIIQFSFIFAAYITIRNATVVAARYATLTVTPSPTVSQIQAVAKQAVTPMLDPSKATATVNTNVTVGPISGATSVQVQYTLPLLVSFVVPGKTPGSSVTLSATTIMQ